MYLRLKTNRSGTTTIVVVEKKDGKQVYVKSIGTSSDPKEIACLTEQGERYIEGERKKRFPELDFAGARGRAAKAELEATEDFLSRIENVLLFFRHYCFREKCHLNFNVLAFNICRFGCLALTLQDVFPKKA